MGLKIIKYSGMKEWAKVGFFVLELDSSIIQTTCSQPSPYGSVLGGRRGVLELGGQGRTLGPVIGFD
jgi:hypothetical protein